MVAEGWLLREIEVANAKLGHVEIKPTGEIAVSPESMTFKAGTPIVSRDHVIDRTHFKLTRHGTWHLVALHSYTLILALNETT